MRVQFNDDDDLLHFILSGDCKGILLPGQGCTNPSGMGLRRAVKFLLYSLTLLQPAPSWTTQLSREIVNSGPILIYVHVNTFSLYIESIFECNMKWFRKLTFEY